MVYRTIVTRKVERTFAEINAGNWQVMVDGLGRDFTYRFHGRHALGGVRSTRESMSAWWERVARLLPGHRIDVQEVVVSGGPRRTRLAVRAVVHGDLPDGSRYENVMFQLMTLRWGKVVEIETLEDLQVLDRALRVVAEHGREEASAAPIEDAPPGR